MPFRPALQPEHARRLRRGAVIVAVRTEGTVGAVALVLAGIADLTIEIRAPGKDGSIGALSRYGKDRLTTARALY